MMSWRITLASWGMDQPQSVRIVKDLVWENSEEWNKFLGIAVNPFDHLCVTVG